MGNFLNDAVLKHVVCSSTICFTTSSASARSKRWRLGRDDDSMDWKWIPVKTRHDIAGNQVHRSTKQFHSYTIYISKFDAEKQFTSNLNLNTIMHLYELKDIKNEPSKFPSESYLLMSDIRADPSQKFKNSTTIHLEIN